MSLGKRKRTGRHDEEASSSEDEDALRARFQKAFEAKFKPLPQKPISRPEVDTLDENDQDDAEDSEWDGLSDDAEDVMVVEHGVLGGEHEDLELSERKAFMSARPPTISADDARLRSTVGLKPEEDSTEATNLKHDLALQRLLKESHLFDPGKFSDKPAASEGKGRIKALDSRLRDLGAKESVSQQDKMPLSHRKGILAKTATREDKRRKDAAANGVVLEKARAATKSLGKRERSIGGPKIGKFSGGTLKLNSRDLKSIEGPKRGRGGRGGRGGRR